MPYTNTVYRPDLRRGWRSKRRRTQQHIAAFTAPAAAPPTMVQLMGLPFTSLPYSGGGASPVTLTQVQRKTNFANSGTTCAVTLSPAATAGNLLIACAVHDKSATAWTAPSGFTLIQEFVGTNVSIWLGYKVATGGETTITMTATNTLAKIFGVYEYSGIANTSPLDVSAIANNDATLVNSQTTGTTGTTAKADELAFAVSGVDSGISADGFARAWTNGFVEDVWVYDTPRSAAPGMSVGLKTLSSVGTVESTYSEAGTADEHAAAIATFKRILTGGYTAQAAVPTSLISGTGWTGTYTDIDEATSFAGANDTDLFIKGAAGTAVVLGFSLAAGTVNNVTINYRVGGATANTIAVQAKLYDGAVLIATGASNVVSSAGFVNKSDVFTGISVDATNLRVELTSTYDVSTGGRFSCLWVDVS